jgi:hypothetical protein
MPTQPLTADEAFRRLSTKYEAAAKLSAKFEAAAKFSAKFEAAEKASATLVSGWRTDDATSRESMRRVALAYIGHFPKREERRPYASDGLQRPIGFVLF